MNETDSRTGNEVMLTTSGTRGPVMAIGGAEDKLGSRSILRRFVDLAGGSRSRISVIPTASRLPDTGEAYAEVLAELGAEFVTVLPFTERRDCSSAEYLDVLAHSTGVFLTGGNQLRLSSICGGSEVTRMIRRLNHDGAVVAGTSAGAAVLSEHMIAYGREGATPRAGMVSIVPGFGLINGVIVDQHFRQRDRLGRLLTAVAYNPFSLGLGLDEDTAVIVDADDWAYVVGTNAVTVVDSATVTHTDVGRVRKDAPISLLDVRLHILVHGAAFNARTREARPAPAQIEERPLAAADNDVAGMASDESGISRRLLPGESR